MDSPTSPGAAVTPAPTAVSAGSRSAKVSPPPPAAPEPLAPQTYTAWTFGELPELMEIRKGGQTLIGFPALVDAGDAVLIEVFDEPDVAAARHRVGLRRLFALQLRDALKYLGKRTSRICIRWGPPT